MNSIELYKESLDLAITYQKAMIATASNIVDNKRILNMDKIRLSYVHDLVDEIEYFTEADLLEQFAVFVNNLNKVMNVKRKKEFNIKPYMMMINHDKDKSYLIAGITSAEIMEQTQDKRNMFSDIFSEAAKQTQITLLNNGFIDYLCKMRSLETDSFIDAIKKKLQE